MMRPRWKKVFTDLWGNKLRSLLVVASITIGLFAVGMIASMHVILTQDMRASYSAVSPANIIITTTGFEQDLLDRIQKVEGVDQVDGLRSLTAQAQTGSGEWVLVNIDALNDPQAMAINQVHLEEGQWPPEKRQAAVDFFKFGNLQTSIGSSLLLELPSGTRRELPLVGKVHDQTIGASQEGGGYFLAPVQLYTTLDTLPWLEQPETMNRLLVTVNGDGNDIEAIKQVAERVSNEVEDAGFPVFTSFARGSEDHPNSTYVQAVASVLFLLGLLVMLLSAFLITNTLSGLLGQQVNQIGIMKTIGARRGQIVGIYLLLIFTFSMIAFLIAVPLASRVSYALLGVLAGQVNVVLTGFRVVPFAVLLMFGIALVVPQLAGIFPILHGTRVSVVEAHSGVSPQKPGARKGLIDRWLGSLRGVSRPMLISLRNTFRRKGRLALTLITLTLGGAIFIATFNVQGSLNSYIARIGQYFLADVNVTLGSSERISEIEPALLQVPGVKAVEGWAFSRGELVMPDGSNGEAVSILAPPAGSQLVVPMVQEGRWIEPGDQNAIALNERFHEIFPDLKPGETVTFDIAGTEQDFQVVGFFQMAGRSSGYLAYTSYNYLSELIGQQNKANAYRVTADRPDLTLAEQKVLGANIKSHLESLGYSVAEVEAGHSLKETTSSGLNILTGFLLIMASLIAIVGSIGLTGTLSMNVLERTREIGIMRSIGANNRTLRNLVMVEGVLIGLISWFLGTLLAFPISILMSNAINYTLFGATVAFTFTPNGIFIWLVVVLTLSVLASVLPARSSARLTIREVLAYE
jgi:putative ABC transport system permease protein